ncbi:MAG: AsmA-like C-terminal region-containing protein, partial [Gammaproteobacteria bacterium]
IDQINFTLNFQSNNLDDFSNGKFSLIHKNSNVRTLLKYLPENLMDPQLISWLNNALSFGTVKSSEIFIDTDNNFNLQMKFEDILLKYALGWPSLEHLSANMKIINDNLEIYMYSTLPAASILNQPVKSLKAKLNLANSEPLLIEAQINSPISKGIEFLQKTNLLQDLGDNLAELSMQGNMDLMFNLLIPVEFNNPEEQFFKYLGECKLNQASLKIANIPIDNIFTNIKFANDYIATDKLIGKAFDIPIHTNFFLEKELLMINNSWFNLKTILAHNTQNNMLKFKEFGLLINELYVLDNLFENIKIINDANMFRLLFNNDNAKGTIIYNKKSSANQLIIDFEKLKIKSKQFKHTNYSDKILLSLIKNINFNCNELYVDDIYLGAINFNVVEDNLKSLGSIVNELKINEFNFSTKSINANFTGNIIKDVNNFNTTINGKVNSLDFGSGLRELNINTKFIANGNGYINFDLNSSADPFTVDLSKITGKLKININSGFILGLDPGFGRVIGLLNIENIQRRLLLDFRDVTNQGFSFDNVIGDLDFNNGELNLNKVFIVGPSANIIISGRTSLLTEQLDLLIEVTSKSGTTLPLAAAVAAGNPVIGAA